MKNLNSILLLTMLSLSFTDRVQATIWDDVLTGLTNKATKPTTTRSESPKTTWGTFDPKTTSGAVYEHATKLAERAAVRAMEYAKSSLASIQNATLHLKNLQQINQVIIHLHNIISNKGNSKEEIEMAKKILREVLSEARKLQLRSKDTAKQVERTLRSTIRLGHHLDAIHGTISSKLGTVSDALKNPKLSQTILDAIGRYQNPSA